MLPPIIRREAGRRNCWATWTCKRLFASVHEHSKPRHLLVPCGSNGHTRLVIHNGGFIERAPAESPLIIYLRSGLAQNSETFAASLSRHAAATVVEIEYRLSNNAHKFPTPVHDVLFGYDWISQNLVRSRDNDGVDVQQPRLGVVGHHIGGGLAAMLALTECTPWKPYIAAAALLDPIVDWTDLTAGTTAAVRGSKRAASRRGEAASKRPWLIEQMLAKRNESFSRPAGYFDPFASPLLFFRHAGQDTPLPDRDSLSTTHDDDFAELRRFEELEERRRARGASAVSTGVDTSSAGHDRSVPSGMNTDAYTSTSTYGTEAGESQEPKVRRTSKRYPPNGSGLVLPCFRFGVSSGGGLADQVDELATRIRKSIVRDCEVKEYAKQQSEQQVQVVTGTGTRSCDDVAGVADWFKETL